MTGPAGATALGGRVSVHFAHGDHAGVGVPLVPTPLDLSGAPGARLEAQRAWASGAGRVEVACVSAPSAAWVPGLEPVLLDGASAVVAKALDASLRPGPPVYTPSMRLWRQTLDGDAAGGHVTGRHHLGFVGQARELCLCTVVCVSPEAEGPCREQALGALVSSRELSDPPVGVASVLLAYPRPTVAIALSALLLGVAVLLWRRPRPGRC